MKEVKGDLWKLPWADVICITTNGYVKANGRAVIGRGCAREAVIQYPIIERWLGSSIRKYGNHVVDLGIHDGKQLFSFPVKHNWWEKADIELIKRSALELTDRISFWHKVLLPRPGCGNGHLSWDEVKPAIESILPDNVWVVSK